MKIALVANAYPPFFIGGAEIAAHRQAIELSRRGHELSCFCGYSDPARAPYTYSLEDVDGVAVTRVNVPGPKFKPEDNFSNAVVEALFDDFLRRQRPDVVHFHNTPGLSLGLLDVCEEFGLPCMITFHDHWGFCLRNTLIRPGETRVCPDWTEHHVCLKEALYQGLRIPTFMRADYIRFKLHKACVFHFPSRYLMAAYGKAHFDLKRAVQHTYGIQPQWFADPGHQPPSGPIRAAFVAYLAHHKGPDVLMRAIERVQERGLLDRFRFDIYGHGEMQSELQAWALRSGWQDHVTVHGKLGNSEMLEVYRQADVMVNCSLWPENEPVTILESLASGTPVIATRIGGNLELVQESVNGWLTEPNADAELASVFVEIAEQPERLRGMRSVARQSVASRTIESYGDFALAAYAGLTPSSSTALPSVIAVACRDFSAIDHLALWRVSLEGYWSQAEWVLAEALRSPTDIGAVVAVLSLDGRLPEELAAALPKHVPVVVLGHSSDAQVRCFDDVTYVPDLPALAALGQRLSTDEGRRHA
jgi:glycosyltransferase involved in cell wall biosynthesis